jgi:thymidylate kinase
VDNSTERKTGVKTILKRTIWPWILFIDDLAFYALRFRKMKGLVISDRYFYDSAVSSVYSGASSSRFFAIYSRFFPSPDIMFLIDVEPKVAYDRKREESLEYLTKKRALYLELYRCVRCRKMKISSDDLRDASLQISSAIFALLTRYESESQNTPKSSVQRPADDS